LCKRRARGFKGRRAIGTVAFLDNAARHEMGPQTQVSDLAMDKLTRTKLASSLIWAGMTKKKGKSWVDNG
jgi:hypothetical protein